MKPSLPLRLKWFFWAHPAWWVVTLCCVAWAMMLLHLSPGHHRGMASANGAEELSGALADWVAMVVAMMLPLVIPHVLLTARGSLWPRRHRAICGFLFGYLAPWCGLGIVASALVLPPWTHRAIVPALLFCSAALWQRTSAYRIGRIACHGTQPLRPTGWQADQDCLRYGTSIGLACVCTCWPLMLACAFSGHALIAMVGGFLVSLVEVRSRTPRSRILLASTLGLGLYYAALAASGYDLSMRM